MHENKDGRVDKTRSDLYLHFVNPNDNSIMDVSNVLRLIDENIELLDDLFKVRLTFNVLAKISKTKYSIVGDSCF